MVGVDGRPHPTPKIIEDTFSFWFFGEVGGDVIENMLSNVFLKECEVTGGSSPPE